MTPENKKLLARMNEARNFPIHTCPASRHVAMIAEHLAEGKPYAMLHEEPEHVAGSLAATVAALWEARQAVVQVRTKTFAQIRAKTIEECAKAMDKWMDDNHYAICSVGYGGEMVANGCDLGDVIRALKPSPSDAKE